MKDIIISQNKSVNPDIQEPGASNILSVTDSLIKIPYSDPILRVCFQDITDDKCSDAFQNEHARQIICFFERIRENEKINCIFVCCDAGISLSPAIAAALMREQGQNDDCIWSDAEYDPNPLVYRQLCHAFGHPVTSAVLRKKLRLNNIAWHRMFFHDLCESLREIAAYEHGEIALRVTTVDADGTRHTEYRKKDGFDE